MKSGYLSLMRRPFFLMALTILIAVTVTAGAATGRVIKVLPQFLDLKGRHALSPSLYERDAYQAYLRWHTNEVSGIRFAIQWKASGRANAPLKLRVELRGSARGELPGQTVLETKVKPGGWFSHWAFPRLTGEAYRKLGELTAWRVTLWEGNRLLSERKSFLW